MKSQILHVDSWGNPVKSYGYCKLDGPEAQGFFVTLVMLVLVSIISGNYCIIILFLYNDPCIQPFIHPCEMIYVC